MPEQKDQHVQMPSMPEQPNFQSRMGGLEGFTTGLSGFQDNISGIAETGNMMGNMFGSFDFGFGGRQTYQQPAAAPASEHKFEVKPLSEGEGDAKPKEGDKVKVHYTGRLLDGTVFDSSHNRGEPLEFTLGKGEVIKGWDQGIGQLKKGQKAQITCPPDYAYGSRSMGNIPANSTLVFEVELVDW